MNRFVHGFELGIGIAAGLCAVYLVACALILLGGWLRERVRT